ncbi:hypothetical protein Tco_0340727 [Tanacetum coccineum]
MTPYTAYHDIQGIIYQDDMDINRLMRTDELIFNLELKVIKRRSTSPSLILQDQILEKGTRTLHTETLKDSFMSTTTRGTDKMDSMHSTLSIFDCDGIPKRLTMYLNLWSYKVVRYRYSNPMIQAEPEGSTQGYPLDSVKVLSIKVKEFQRSFRHSDTERLSRSDKVLKLKNFKKDATLKLFKSTNQERYEHVGPEVTSSQDGETRLCLVDDLKVLKITFSHSR